MNQEWNWIPRLPHSSVKIAGRSKSRYPSATASEKPGLGQKSFPSPPLRLMKMALKPCSFKRSRKAITVSRVFPQSPGPHQTPLSSKLEGTAQFGRCVAIRHNVGVERQTDNHL